MSVVPDAGRMEATKRYNKGVKKPPGVYRTGVFRIGSGGWI